MRWLQLVAVVVGVSLFACESDSKDFLAPSPRGPLYAVGSDPATGATIETDQDDYLPGEIVHLTGSGWAANESVHLEMTEDPDTHGDVVQDVQADTAGGFSVPFYDVQPHDLGVAFTLTGTGAVSGSVVTVRFVDGRAIATLTLNGSSAVTVASAAAINAVATGQLTGNNQNTLGSVGIKAFVHGANANTATPLTCSDVNPDLGPSSPSNSIPFSHAFSFNAPAAGGVYDVIVTSYGDNACATTGGASSLTMANAITVQAQANQTISFGPLANKTFGDQPFTVSATATSGLVVSFSSQTGATCGVLGTTVTILHAGTCTVRASQDGNPSFNPAPNVDQSFTIAQASANITVTGFSGFYDGAPHGASGSATGVNGEDLSGLLNLGAAFTDAPGGTAFWVFSGSGDYNDASGDVAIDIAPRSVTATITAADKVYNGDAWAVITHCSVNGTLGTDDVVCTASDAVFADANAGEDKDVSATVSLTGSASGNYTLDINTTSHTTASISRKPVTATITAADKTYDGNAAATITACTVHTKVGSDDVGCVGSDGAFADANAGDDKDVGATVSLNGSASGNYTFGANTDVHTTASIHKAPLTVTADDQHKTYDGAAFWPFPATITGFVNGENVSVIGGSPAVGGNAVGAVNAGSYTITPLPGSLQAANYDFATFVDGTLTIAKAPLTVTADNKSKVFDNGPYTQFTATISGFVNGENASVVSGGAGFDGPAISAVYPGTYAITPTVGSLDAANYAFTSFVNGTLTIIAWTLTGFYQPVDMPNSGIVWNSVKGGSTVPLKFEIFAGAVERTEVGSVLSFTQTKVTCDASSPTDDVEFTTTGGTSLRYDGGAGQFIQNWQTPKQPGQCYKVTMTALDGSKLFAFFKLK